MSDVIKSLRSGADRAAFAAGKLMRLQRVQYEQKTREQQRREYVEQLGEAVWQLYAQGRVSDPELVSVCHQIQATTHQIGELQKAAASLRNEQAARPSKCLDCGHDVSAGDAFCPFCGTKTGAGDPLDDFGDSSLAKGWVDGIVNGSGATAQGAGSTLQPTQSGKVNLYGALLFGSAAVGALVLVLVNS